MMTLTITTTSALMTVIAPVDFQIVCSTFLKRSSDSMNLALMASATRRRVSFSLSASDTSRPICVSSTTSRSRNSTSSLRRSSIHVSSVVAPIMRLETDYTGYSKRGLELVHLDFNVRQCRACRIYNSRLRDRHRNVCDVQCLVSNGVVEYAESNRIPCGVAS